MNFLLKKTIIIFLFSLTAAYAQFDSVESAAEEVIDDLLEEPAEEVESSELYQMFDDLRENPIDINSASIDDIERIPLLNFSDAELIIKHREKYGRFFSASELYSVRGIPQETIRKILPFVKVTTPGEDKFNYNIKRNFFGSMFLNSGITVRSRVVKDLQTRKGFAENKFAGSQYKIYNRILGRLNDNIQFGVVTEKDAGEKSLYDFVSMHLALYNLGIIKKIVIGDYIPEFGQGLSLWSPYGLSKGGEAVYPLKKSERGLTPFKSTNENKFFRGIASQINYNFLNISLFYSKNSLDANIDPYTNEIISTPLGGLHRTDTEVREKNTASETVYGIGINSNWNEYIRTGLLYYSSKFSNPFLSSTATDINGNYFKYYSFYFNIIYSKINLFGETAYDGKTAAEIAGLEFFPVDNFAYAVSLRNYPANFINLHGFGFGESSNTKNELGFYTGIKWRTRFGLINFYYDQYKFPYATYSNPMPSHGYEFLISLSSMPFGSVETKLRMKYEKKDVNGALDNIVSIVNRIRQNIRTEILFKINNNFSLKGRFEYNNSNILSTGQNENGVLVYQEAKISALKWLTFYGRIIFFKTDSFNSAVYEYESGLTGVLSSSALFGEGIRWYAILKIKTPFNFMLSLKYSETYKPEEKTLGSSYSTINGNLDNNFSMQMDMEF